ncbi:branched-chain amino acid ABC transporter permease [Pigmentiphaga sp. GD03639]|jgi:branched-chain amino acid transport system permease protein|uniref:Branched-chain amino acid ABC transporter permease n=1 Tax=Pigmentiphaga daeguensis TaxID=414049 RepID=A0ABN1D400_9BURK|nr:MULTISPECIES: branched-chain amino acid ABC transporter permease [unclassified Pigmentiphaga]MDH2240037.1 branched-chain amino acid ABC transporter permease [Pigmentiphaga sp. GD03639]OVZ66512.1 branched-chain amino acid ABC transporter permease [Pigmentiphaga sp. NML030171]
MALLFEQLLNGLQFGAMLFMLASGLTLIFGIMGVINLTHGSFYMVGAYCGAFALGHTNSFAAGVVAALAGAALYGLLVEFAVIRRLYKRDHLYQVLATFGLILFTNEAVSMIFGRQPPMVEIPAFLDGTVPLAPGFRYPLMRLAFIVVGALVALGLWFLINRTRVGMLVRAGADDREMVDALGIDIQKLYSVVFGLGALLCGLAGVMAAPLLAVEIGMGERVLITTFVVIVIGGVGSVRGAMAGALLVGMVDSLGRAYFPQLLGAMLSPEVADMLAAGLVSASVYVLMALVLIFRPKGLLG